MVPEREKEAASEYEQESQPDAESPGSEPRVSSRSLTIQLIASISIMLVVGVSTIFLYQVERRHSLDESFNNDDAQVTKPKKKRARRVMSEAEMHKLADSDPEALIRLGEDLATAGKYSNAEAAYDVAIEGDDSDAKLFRLRGIARKMQGKFDDAQSDFDRALELNPENADNLAARAQLLWDQGHVEKARAEIDKAQSIDPADYKLYLLSALMLTGFRDEGSIAAGLNETNKALKLSNSPDCLAMKALYEWRAKNESISDAFYRKAVDKGSGSAMTNYCLMMHQLDRKDFKTAMEFANKTIKLRPLYVWNAYMWRAMLYAQLFEQEKAIASFNKAVALNPKNGELFFKRSSIYLELNRKEEALEDMNRVIALMPKLPYYYEIRADINLSLRLKEAAFKDCEVAIALGGGNAKVYKLKSGALIDLGKREEALEAVSHAISLSPDYDAARLARAQIYLDRKEYQKAVDDYTSCLNRHPDLPRALQGRAEAYEKMGKKDLAQRDRSGVIKDYGNILDAVHSAGTSFRNLLNKSEGIDRAKQETKDNQ